MIEHVNKRYNQKMKLWKISEKLWDIMKCEGKRAGKWWLRGKANYTFSWSTRDNLLGREKTLRAWECSTVGSYWRRRYSMHSGRFASEARNGRIVRNYCKDIRISPMTWKFKKNQTKSGKKIIGFNVNIKEQLKTLRDKIKKAQRHKRKQDKVH